VQNNSLLIQAHVRRPIAGRPSMLKKYSSWNYPSPKETPCLYVSNNLPLHQQGEKKYNIEGHEVP